MVQFCIAKAGTENKDMFILRDQIKVLYGSILLLSGNKNIRQSSQLAGKLHSIRCIDEVTMILHAWSRRHATLKRNNNL